LNAVRKALLVAQRFKCAVCGRFLGGGKIAFLDHAHGSGELRGMLCFHCNRFRVAKNTRDTAEEVVRYLADPPAAKELPAILRAVKGSAPLLMKTNGGTPELANAESGKSNPRARAY
jgi:hypothetical protein